MKTKTKTNKLLSLSSKLIPALILSLAVLSFAGGRVSAASVTYLATPVNGLATTEISAGNLEHPYQAYEQYTYSLANSAVCAEASISDMTISFDTLDMEGVVGDDGVSINQSQPAYYLPSYPSFDGATPLTPDSYLGSFIQQGDKLVAQNDGTYIFKILAAPGMTVADLAKTLIVFGSENSLDMDSFLTTQPQVILTYDNSTCPQTPLATDPDTSTTPPSTPVTLNILGNDTGSSLSVTKVDGQSISPGQTITLTNGSGTATLNNDGTITFTPANGFTGQSTFSYSISDGTNEVDTGVVIIDVAGPISTSTSTSAPASTASTTATTSTKASQKTLASTGTNLSLILALALTTSIAALSLRKFSKR